VFGIESLLALRAYFDRSKVISYLDSFGDGGNLGLIDLACLARCRAALDCVGGDIATGIAGHLEKYHCAGGGYNIDGCGQGKVYGCFLALAAYQDIQIDLPDADRLLDCVKSLKTEDGGYANETGLEMSLTPTTAAALMIGDSFNEPKDGSAINWLFSRLGIGGGFYVMDNAPIADLLSTATALHTLGTLGVAAKRISGPVRERCFDYIESLWDSRGGFYGNEMDRELDCEYVFYGLLAMGQLSKL
jgi:prenyltransferase beta subunit